MSSYFDLILIITKKKPFAPNNKLIFPGPLNLESANEIFVGITAMSTRMAMNRVISVIYRTTVNSGSFVKSLFYLKSQI